MIKYVCHEDDDDDDVIRLHSPVNNNRTQELLAHFTTTENARKENEIDRSGLAFCL